MVILTPYLGQLFKYAKLVRERLKEISSYISDCDQLDLDDLDPEAEPAGPSCGRKITESIGCSSVDKFQGEEAPIIVAMLI